MKVKNLPGKWDLYKYTGLPYYNDWQEGAEANALLEQMTQKQKSIDRWALPVTIISFLAGGFFLLKSFTSGIMNDTFLSDFVITIILFIVSYIVSKKSKRATEDKEWAASQRQNAIYRHTDIFIEPLADHFMSQGWRSYRTGRQCIIYGSDGFVYFDAYNRTLVAYNRSNIKEVTRERVYLGSSTTSRAGSYTSSYDDSSRYGSAHVSSNTSTSGYSNTTNYYEWHLDIFTDFVDYPKVSFVLSDTGNTADVVGKIYAVLKP